ncbi:hypothetical protein GCM10010129_12720 [Streptomyces fumigatiscleroticus]|nr:hypothetical protein GCM10010129_12720 [Streptomyces fumigatiscleroticus]
MRRIALRPEVSSSQKAFTPFAPGTRTPMPVITVRRVIVSRPSFEPLPSASRSVPLHAGGVRPIAVRRGRRWPTAPCGALGKRWEDGGGTGALPVRAAGTAPSAGGGGPWPP